MSDNIVGSVFKKGVLFDITVGSWSAIHLMKPDDLLMSSVNKKAMHLGHKYLIARENLADVVALEGKIRRFVAMRSTSFPIAGAVFIPYRSMKETLNGLKKLEEKYKAAAQELVDNFPTYKAKQLSVLDDEAERIAMKALEGYVPNTDPWKARKVELDKWLATQRQRHRELYPEQEEILPKFYVSYRMFKIDPVEGSEYIDDDQAAIISKASEELKNSMEAWVKESTFKLHKVLGEKAKQARDLLEKQGKLHPKNLRPLFDAFSEFRAVDFAGSTWQTTIDSIFAKYGATTKDGEIDFDAVSTMVGDDFSQLLDSMAKLAVDEIAESATNNALSKDFKRLVEL